MKKKATIDSNELFVPKAKYDELLQLYIDGRDLHDELNWEIEKIICEHGETKYYIDGAEVTKEQFFTSCGKSHQIRFGDYEFGTRSMYNGKKYIMTRANTLTKPQVFKLLLQTRETELEREILEHIGIKSVFDNFYFDDIDVNFPTRFKVYPED